MRLFFVGQAKKIKIRLPALSVLIYCLNLPVRCRRSG
jgi:hypothetical protein